MDGGIEQNPAYGTARPYIYTEYDLLGSAFTLPHTLTDTRLVSDVVVFSLLVTRTTSTWADRPVRAKKTLDIRPMRLPRGSLSSHPANIRTARYPVSLSIGRDLRTTTAAWRGRGTPRARWLRVRSRFIGGGVR